MHVMTKGKYARASLGKALVVAMSLGMVGAVAAQEAQEAPAVSTTTSAAPTDEQLASARCVRGMEKFLPGEYFYCLGAQSYGQNKRRYADKFFKEAAGWASKPAQYVLGVMALNGDGQPVNRPLAFAWFTLASERHNPRFQQPYDELKATLSPAEIGKADGYLASMKLTYGDEVAARRAEDRYRDGVARLPKGASPGTYCIQGAVDYHSAAGTDDMASGSEAEGTAACGTADAVTRYVDSKAADVFEGWSGHVSVGPVAAVPAGEHLPRR